MRTWINGKTHLAAMLGLLLLGFDWVPARAEYLIDNLTRTDSQGEFGIDTQFSPLLSEAPYYGQTFTISDTNQLAKTLQFSLKYHDLGGTPSDLTFHVLLTTMTGAETTARPDTVLYESGDLTLSRSQTDFTPFLVDLGATPLLANEVYAFVLDADVTRGSTTLALADTGLRNEYAGGYFFCLLNPPSGGDRATNFAMSTLQVPGNGTSDLAFRLSTNTIVAVPEPASLALTGLGLAGLIGGHAWRRRRKSVQG